MTFRWYNYIHGLPGVSPSPKEPSPLQLGLADKEPRGGQWTMTSAVSQLGWDRQTES